MSHLDKKGSKNEFYNYCECCDYTASQKSNWFRHLNTKKHLKRCNQNVTKKGVKGVKKYECENCIKKYKSRMGIYRHKKICKKPKPQTQTIIQNITNITNNNQKTNINNQKTNINTFNANLFLNEHCKNAMNLEDFVNSINLSLKDLDYTTKNGYVEGMTSILTKSLGDLSPTDRPIHSTDEKRLKFMVKNEEGWIKDDGSQLNNVVTNTKFKLVDTLSEWEKENPGYNGDSKKLDTWQKSLSSISPEPSIKEKYDNAIKKKLAKLSSIKGAMDSIKE